MKFPDLTYASPTDPAFKRWVIITLERLAGRDYFVPHYEKWRREYVGTHPTPMAGALELLGIELRIESGRLPDNLSPTAPLVIVANHPFGIVDGFGALTLAERLDRPFRILIHKDLVKVPEMQPYSLPINFRETKEAQAENIRVRKEALELLKQGTTIIVFPAGGVATSPSVYGRAVDLPWKTFTARMILAARADVLPVYFEGQCTPFFQFISKISLTLRLSTILREFRRRVGRPLKTHIGEIIPFETIEQAAGQDRRQVMAFLRERVYAMSDLSLDEVRTRMARLPRYLLPQSGATSDRGKRPGKTAPHPRPR